MNTYELSWFDWATISFAGLLLLSVIGTLFGLVVRSIYREISRLDECHKLNREQSQNGDNALAETLSKIATQFQEHQLDEIKSSIRYIQREEWIAESQDSKERAKRIHDRIDQIVSLVNEIKAGYVPKDDCQRMHENYGGRHG